MTEEYWRKHKELYVTMLDELDPDIRKIILRFVHSEEADDFNEKVDRAVRKALDLPID